MIVYTKIHKLLKEAMRTKGLSLRKLEQETGIDYGTLWRLLKANNNTEVFKNGGKDHKGKPIMNLTASTLDKLCCYFNEQPAALLQYKKD